MGAAVAAVEESGVIGGAGHGAVPGSGAGSPASPGTGAGTANVDSKHDPYVRWRTARHARAAQRAAEAACRATLVEFVRQVRELEGDMARRIAGATATMAEVVGNPVSEHPGEKPAEAAAEAAAPSEVQAKAAEQEPVEAQTQAASAALKTQQQQLRRHPHHAAAAAAAFAAVDPVAAWTAFEREKAEYLAVLAEPETAATPASNEKDARQPATLPPDLAFPNSTHPSTRPLIAGLIDRKSRTRIKGYSPAYFVITPAGYMHAFAPGAADEPDIDGPGAAAVASSEATAASGGSSPDTSSPASPVSGAPSPPQGVTPTGTATSMDSAAAAAGTAPSTPELSLYLPICSLTEYAAGSPKFRIRGRNVHGGRVGNALSLHSEYRFQARNAEDAARWVTAIRGVLEGTGVTGAREGNDVTKIGAVGAGTDAPAADTAAHAPASAPTRQPSRLAKAGGGFSRAFSLRRLSRGPPVGHLGGLEEVKHAGHAHDPGHENLPATAEEAKEGEKAAETPAQKVESKGNEGNEVFKEAKEFQTPQAEVQAQLGESKQDDQEKGDEKASAAPAAATVSADHPAPLPVQPTETEPPAVADESSSSYSKDATTTDKGTAD